MIQRGITKQKGKMLCINVRTVNKILHTIISHQMVLLVWIVSLKKITTYSETQIARCKMFSKQSPQTTKDVNSILTIIEKSNEANAKTTDLAFKVAHELLELMKILKAKGVISQEEGSQIIKAGKDA